MIENFQKMRNFIITKIRNFDSFSFRDVSYSFVPRVMRDGVDALERARPVCTEALIFICSKLLWKSTILNPIFKKNSVAPRTPQMAQPFGLGGVSALRASKVYRRKWIKGMN